MNCTIAFSLDVHWDWPKLCTITEHELGHLNGNAHVVDASNVMSDSYFEATPECLHAAMPGASSAIAKASSHTGGGQTRKARTRTRSAR